MLPLLAFLMGFVVFLPTSSTASHVIGGDLGYKHLQGDSFLITATVLVDCQATVLPDSTIIISGIGHAYYDTVTLSISSIKDVTNVCDTVTTRCSNPSSLFPFGVNQIIYTGIVDLSSANGCEVRIGYSGATGINYPIFTRNGFYIESQLNKCVQNNSPVLVHQFPVVACVAVCVNMSLAGFDPDGDSLVYSLASPFSGPNVMATFNSPYSWNNPLPYNGFPNANLPYNPPLCRGFHLDSFSGDLNFRILAATKAAIVFKVEEYRNGVKIGEIMREFPFTLYNCPPNTGQFPFLDSSPTSIDADNVPACVGDEMEVSVAGFIDSSDSIQFSHTTTITGGSFSVSGDTAFFRWTPTMADTQSKPYQLTIFAKSSNCNIIGTSSRTFSIYAQENTVEATHSITDLGCGTYAFSADSFPANASVTWEVEGEQLANLHASSFTHTFAQGGTYPISLTVEAGCLKTYYDTVHVDPIFHITLPEADTTCHGDSLMLIAQVHSGPADSFRWSTGATGASISHVMNSDGLLSVTAYRGGCSTSDSIYLTEAEAPAVALWPDVVLCPNDSVELVALATLQDSTFGPIDYAWQGPQNLQGQVHDRVWVNTPGRYIAIASSRFRCTGMDTIEVLPFTQVHTQPDTAVCAGAGSFHLSATPTGGTWSGPGLAATAGGLTFNPGGLSTGTFTLVYSYTDSQSTCTVTDTMEVEILPVPGVMVSGPDTICLGDTVSLTASSNASVQWAPAASLSTQTGNAVQAFPTFTTTYTVTATSSHGCMDSAYLTVAVDSNCVWPGDANADGVVNNLDLLPIGLFFSETGSQRPNASLQWNAQKAQNWDSTASAGYNLKHVDTDGDGTVASQDTAAISLNYSLSHPRGAGARSSVALWLDGPSTLEPGETVVYDLYLGNSTSPAQDAYGLAFSIEYPAEHISQAELQFVDGLGQGSELVMLTKPFPQLGRIDAAVSRTDRTSRDGVLKIGQLILTMAEELTDGELLNFAVADITAVNPAGEIKLLQESTATPEVETPTAISEKAHEWDLELYPNPVNHELFISADIDLERVTVLDMVGKQVPVPITVNGNRAKVNTIDLQQGLYLVQIETEQGTLIRKVLVE